MGLGPAPRPPAVEKRPRASTWFGRDFDDDYAWLRNPDWFDLLHTPERLDPEIRAHLDAENAYADAVLAPTGQAQAEMIGEILARGAGALSTPPTPDGPYEYWEHLEPGAEHPRFLRRRLPDAEAELLFDADAGSRGKPYYRLSEFTEAGASPDHRFFAWAADETGDQHFRIYVRDLATGETAPAVEHGYGFFAISPDSSWLYWVYRDPVSRPTKVFRRPLMGGADELVYEEADPSYFLSVRRAASGACILIQAHKGDADETWLVGDDGRPRCVEPRQTGVHYEVEPWGEKLLVLTNADGAWDYKLMLADPDQPGRSGWRELTPHRPGRFIAGVQVFRDHVARLEWRDANPHVVVMDREGREFAPAFAEAAWSLRLAPTGHDSNRLRCLYQSPRTPPRWIDYDLAAGREIAVRETPVPGFDASGYEVRRLHAPATDGELVPITLLTRAGETGARPLYLYGYGSYGYSVEPVFAPAHLALVDRGVSVAIAHIRGGGEKGPRWFEAVRGAGKKLSITDFIACADHLVSEGVTAPGRMVGHSLSAGGIVIGGSANARPELWAGLIAQVPFVDVLNTLHDASNPLLPGAFSVWGDPADPAIFDYVASYSPYENINAHPYPAVLAYGGLLDNRVGYWEPAKWAARIRERSTSGRPALLKIDMTAGHQGHAGLRAEAERAAYFNAFTLWAVGALT